MRTYSQIYMSSSVLGRQIALAVSYRRLANSIPWELLRPPEYRARAWERSQRKLGLLKRSNLLGVQRVIRNKTVITRPVGWEQVDLFLWSVQITVKH